MVIRITSSVATVIQAVSPLLGTGAGAAAGAEAAAAAIGAAAAAGAGAAAGVAAALAVAAGALAGVAGDCAIASVLPISRPRPRPREVRSFFMSKSLSAMCWVLEGFLAGLTGPDAHDLLQVVDEDLPVADLAGAGCAFDGFDDAVHQIVGHRRLDLHLGQEVDDVFRAAIQLGVALLPSETLDLGDGDALHPDARQRFADFVEL